MRSVCVGLVVVFYLVGLWPFDFWPPNNVAWVSVANGLRFRPPAIVYSAGRVDFLGGESHSGLTIELDLQPADEPSWEIGSILSILEEAGPSTKLEIAQLRSGLLLRAALPHSGTRRWYREVAVEAGLKRGVRRRIAISSGPKGTNVCVDGLPAGSFPKFRLDATPLSGRLIVGIDPTGYRNWQGDLFGLAALSRALEAPVAVHRQELWRSGRFGELASDPGVTAFYSFDEGSGNTVRDQSSVASPLLIPSHYRRPYRRVLIRPADEWSSHYAHYVDLARNILGFMPLGFFCFLYRMREKPGRRHHAAVWSVLAAGATSLGIELIQVYLPMRSSSLLDLISNMAGAFIGVLIAIPALRHSGARRATRRPAPRD